METEGDDAQAMGIGVQPGTLESSEGADNRVQWWEKLRRRWRWWSDQNEEGETPVTRWKGSQQIIFYLILFWEKKI